MNTIVNWRAGNVSPVAASLVDGVPVTVGKVDVVTVNECTGGTDPVASTVRSVQHQLAVLPPRQHDSASLHVPLPIMPSPDRHRSLEPVTGRAPMPRCVQ